MKKVMKSKLKSIAGLSFLEIMIALGITSFVTAAVFRLYVTQHHHYISQDRITEVQQNARASIDQLARTIRMAGFDVPSSLAPLQAYNTNSDTIVLCYRDNNCGAATSINMANGAVPIVCASAINCFTAGEWVYIYHPDSGGGEWFQISSIDPVTNTVFHVSDALSKGYSKDAMVISMEEIKFFVDTTTIPGTASLMVQNRGQAPIVFADNIVDLQFRYKMKNGMTLDVPPLVDNVREVLITLTGRSINANPDDVNPYKFRTFNTAVSLRNFTS